MVTSFGNTCLFVSKFVPRCGIREEGGGDTGRGVTGNWEADSPSVCFFIAGRLPEFCFKPGQFDPEIGVLAGCWFCVDTVGPTVGALARCCFANGPLLGVNV